MALVVKNRVLETSTSSGTGTFTLNGAVTGFRTFLSAISNGNTTYYGIESVDSDGIPTGQWETGIGTVTGSTLTRDTVLESSNSNNKVDFAGGTKKVWCNLDALRFLTTQARIGNIAIGEVTTNTISSADTNGDIVVNANGPIASASSGEFIVTDTKIRMENPNLTPAGYVNVLHDEINNGFGTDAPAVQVHLYNPAALNFPAIFRVETLAALQPSNVQFYAGTGGTQQAFSFGNFSNLLPGFLFSNPLTALIAGGFLPTGQWTFGNTISLSSSKQINVLASGSLNGDMGLDGGLVVNNLAGSTGDLQVKGDTDNNTLFVDVSADSVGAGTASPNSKLHVNGSFSTAYVAKTSTYTASSADHTINCTSGTFTVNLPTASGITGRIYVIKNSGTGVITVDGNSSETIDGAATYSLSVQYQSVTVQSDGANWIII